MKWGFKDLSNGDTLLPSYLWVFDTRKQARDFKRVHVTRPYASHLSGIKKFTKGYLDNYLPVPQCIRPEYWKHKRYGYACV